MRRLAVLTWLQIAMRNAALVQEPQRQRQLRGEGACRSVLEMPHTVQQRVQVPALRMEVEREEVASSEGVGERTESAESYLHELHHQRQVIPGAEGAVQSNEERHGLLRQLCHDLPLHHDAVVHVLVTQVTL